MDDADHFAQIGKTAIQLINAVFEFARDVDSLFDDLVTHFSREARDSEGKVYFERVRCVCAGCIQRPC